MSTNKAAWITAAKRSPLEVKEAPYPSPGAKDIVVKVHAVAINPLEYKIQDTNPPVGGKTIAYPTIFGADLAGVVVQTGSSVTKVQVGQRVMANPSGLSKASAAFQHFVQLPEHYATPVPDDMPFEKAVVLPLACDTAAAGLFVPDKLGLPTDGLHESRSSTRGVVLVWGGSSSVGCCAIQLASAAGYEVITTASKRNHDLCSSLGAVKVFDHSHDDVEKIIISELAGKTVVGVLDCISDAEKTIPACVRIVAETKGARKVVTVLTPPEDLKHESVVIQRLSIPAMLGTPVYDAVHAFLETGLSDGRLQPKPDPQVIGDGLESIQAGIDAVRKGVSATKIVVRLA